MKKALSCLFAVLLSLQFSTQASGQLYSSDEMIAMFHPDATQGEIETLLVSWNMHILDGPTSNIGAVLLKFNPSGPPPWAYSNPIDPINGVVESAVPESKVDGAGLNFGLVSLSKNSQTYSSQSEDHCYSILDPMTQPNGAYPVNTAIFDTGITSLASVYTPFFDPPNLGYNYINPVGQPFDDHNHGTHISSIIMENLDNTNEAIDLFAYKTHDAFGDGNLFDVIKALDKAISQNIQIINMSFSFYDHHSHKEEPKAPLRVAIDMAKIAGILCITSSGNDNNDNDNETLTGLSAFPSSYPNDNIISVASVGCNLTKSSWSNYGLQSVDVAAPGEDIWGYDRNGNYITWSGTSQATAFVTKLATYLASFQDSFDWELTKCAILTGVIPLPGVDYVSSDGYINSALALDVLLATPPCNYDPPPLYMVGNDKIDEQNGIYFAGTATGSPLFGISTMNKHSAEVVITNTLGELLFAETIELEAGTFSYYFDFPQKQELGIYFLTLKGEGKLQTLKFIY